jgi:hypothetical protein
MRVGVLGFAAFPVGVEGHLDLEFCLAVLGDGEQCLTVVETLQGIEDCILLNFAAFDLPLSPSRLALSID